MTLTSANLLADISAGQALWIAVLIVFGIVALVLIVMGITIVYEDYSEGLGIFLGIAAVLIGLTVGVYYLAKIDTEGTCLQRSIEKTYDPALKQFVHKCIVWTSD